MPRWETTVKEERKKAICGLMFLQRKKIDTQTLRVVLLLRFGFIRRKKKKGKERKETFKNVKQTKPKQQLVSK